MLWVCSGWQYCSNVDFVVKADDDVFINIFRLIRVLENPRVFGRPVWQNNIIYCSTNLKSLRIPDPEHKHYVTNDEYPDLTYPTYCNGYFYITIPEVVKQLYKLSLRTRFFWTDDVYFTGILAEHLTIKRVKTLTPFAFKRKSAIRPPYTQYMFIYDDSGKNLNVNWLRLWNRVLRSAKRKKSLSMHPKR